MRICLTFGLAALSAPLWATMPPAEQNALVKQYCAVCHNDKAVNGGLSLEHYDAAKRDPALAAMLLSKLNNGAMGAAGKGVPDKAAQQAWLESTREQAFGSAEWFVSLQDGVVSASTVRDVPPRGKNPAFPVYRLKVSCDTSTGAGEMRLMWSPDPQTGRTIAASVDGAAPIDFAIEGHDSMGNGTAGESGRASLLLNTKDAKLPLPKRSLVIRDLFQGEAVGFPFSDLDPKVQAELGRCF